MKKVLFLAALSCVALASCESEDLTVANNAQVLRFDAPATIQQTRANVMGEISGVKYPAGENFQVYCKAYKGAFAGTWAGEGIIDYFNANGEEAFNDGKDGTVSNYWSTSIVHYWPEAEYNLAFAAYSPSKLTTAPTSIGYTDNGLQIKNFKTEAECDDQYDLMYSTRKYDLNKTNNSNAAVPIVFKHALSSIVFSSQKSSADVNYEITSIKVDGLFCQEADFDQNITGSTAEGVYSEQDAAEWTNLVPATGNVTYTPTFAPFSVPIDAPAQFTSGNSAMLLIPQEVPAEATVTVNYTKTTNPGKEGEKVLEASAKIKLLDFEYQDNGVSKKITEWEMGNRYIYRIAFGENTRIYFEPSVTDWVTLPTLIYTIK